MSKVHNFSAGPCILPQEVFEKSAEAIKNFKGTGLSILEVSHRSKEFVEVMEEARNLIKEVLEVPDGYTVLYIQGGASLGFLISALNMIRDNEQSAYINTGVWSTKAIKEALFAGDVIEVASSEDKNFTYIPKDIDFPTDVDYLHYTSNNTIHGTQFKSTPKTDLPLVCDMSSDIFSKRINVADFDIIYAGAQKNLGPAGATIYIVKDSILGKSTVDVPTYLDLQTHVKKDSMFNTPPVFSVYCAMLTLQWLKRNGGIDWIEKKNNEKAELLYNEIDSNPMFEGTTAKEDRSNMNATFVLKDQKYKEEFDTLWKGANISGINGHRSVGGYRASMYNALPIESVQALVDTMRELAKKHA